MKKKKLTFERFMAMTDAERRAEVAPYDKEDLTLGKPLTAMERKQFEHMVKRGRPRVGLGAEKIRIPLERGLLMRTDEMANRLHISRSEVIANGLKKLLK